MSEPERQILSAHFVPEVSLDIFELERVGEPVVSSHKLHDLSAADSFLRESYFRRVEEWVPGDDNDYHAYVEYLGEDDPIVGSGAETVRLIDLTTGGGVTHGPMEKPQHHITERSHGNLDRGVDLE